MADSKQKKYIADYADLMEEWDWDKNQQYSFNPSEITLGSNKKPWWKCSKSHSYSASAKNIANGRRCPYCAGKKVLIGFNDLETWCNNHDSKHLIQEYSPHNITPITAYTHGTHRSVQWICPNGHTYEMSISARTANKYGCPVCSNHRIQTGYNDLQTWAIKYNPILITEFSSRNYTSMNQLAPNSSEKVLWICSTCGQEYSASPNSRVNMESGCPYCSKRMNSSFPEQACFFYVKQLFPDAINGYCNNNHKITELDIYIPSQKIGIEYDGKHWHRSKKAYERAVKKYQACRLQGIKLVRIQESDNALPGQCDIIILCLYDYRNYEQLESAIQSLLYTLDANHSIDINLARDSQLIKEQYYSILKENSLAKIYPHIAKEWHPTKNGDITPYMVSKSASDTVWWQCSVCGREYKSSINNRVGYKTAGCPQCISKRNCDKFKKEVFQFSLDGKFIRKYSSLKEAKLCTGAASISMCCHNKLHSSGGYIWSFSRTLNSEKK